MSIRYERSLKSLRRIGTTSQAFLLDRTSPAAPLNISLSAGRCRGQSLTEQDAISMLVSQRRSARAKPSSPLAQLANRLTKILYRRFIVEEAPPSRPRSFLGRGQVLPAMPELYNHRNVPADHGAVSAQLKNDEVLSRASGDACSDPSTASGSASDVARATASTRPSSPLAFRVLTYAG